jgi:hypothetical protein
MRPATYAVVATAFALALVTGCKQPETQLKLVFPPVGDGGAGDGGLPCEAQTNVRCVNYLQFTAGKDEFESRCTKLDVSLNNLCDLGKAAVGQEIFNLPPETQLPIKIEGLRVFPTLDCHISECADKTVFAGETVGTGTIGDYAGRVLELPVTVQTPCGPPEEFYFLLPGRTCQEVCGMEPVICDDIVGGCLCQAPGSASDIAAGRRGVDAGQGGIDGGQ